MTRAEARKIGGRKGLISSVVGLITAYLIMAMMTGIGGRGMDLGWIADAGMQLNMVLGAVIMLISGYLWGQLAGITILINKKNHLVAGILCGIGALMTTAFLSGLPGFLLEGMPWKYSIKEGFESYVVKPFTWITVFGIIPAVAVGVWMGWRIKRCRI
ncbi:hypothetical protein [Flavipsychrobacter stenotrophus]|nr:hypothetical protein [Flavipsychrobacter stenotrophus]